VAAGGAEPHSTGWVVQLIEAHVMERRTFIALVSGGLLAAPRGAEWERVAKVPPIGAVDDTPALSHREMIRTPADIERAFSMATQSRLQGMCLTSDGLIYVEQRRLAQLAQERNLPLIEYTREIAQWPGMLMTYGPSNVALFKRAAYFVDKILKGAKPADLPVEQATIIELVINLKTAKALGLSMPQSLLLQADEIIQ
jgi:hypothetical protein